MNLLLVIGLLTAASGVAAVVADRAGRGPAFYLLKPLTTVFIIALAALAPTSDYRTLLLVGLVLSLAGDVALMFSSNRAFLLGLGSFLLAHLAFVFAFLLRMPAFEPPLWTLLPVLLGLAVFVKLLRGAGPLLPAVAVYGAALLAMVLTAASTGDALLISGALLFLLSDSLLGLRRFVGEFRYAQALILGTYWPAIALMALSAHGLHP